MSHLRQRQKVRQRQLFFEPLESRRMLASDFTLAVLPDTQYYSELNPAIFEAQTQWIAANVQSRNIAFVSHVGDVVEHATSLSEWQNADAAMDVLDGVVPYAVLPGNHDFTPVNTHDGATNFISNFGAARYAGAPWYGGSSANQLNHYQRFSADGIDFLHLALEWEPRLSTVAWAQSILDAHPGTPAIVTTHAYLRPTGGRFTGAVTTDGLDGEQLFQSLVAVNPQIFLVMGGHFSGEAHQVSWNHAGFPVLELLVDYQSRPNGGDGWMQLLNFRPDHDVIEVTTFSPTLGQFETDTNSQFSLPLDFDARLNIAGPPLIAVSSPRDNGAGDADPATGRVSVTTAQANFEFTLSDIVPGVDDATVTASTVQLTRDGVPLASPADYIFQYDAGTDRLTLTPGIGLFSKGLYRVTLNGGSARIADLAGNPMPHTELEIAIDTSDLEPPESLYFSLGSPTTFPNGLVADNDDIVLFDGTDFSLYFDGSDVGLEAFTIDAMAILSATEILLSFTGSGAITGIPGTVDDSDIVKFTATELGPLTSGTFTQYFDASDVGLTTSDEDIDALAVLENGHLLISTKGLFEAGGIVGDDEDLFEFTPITLGANTAGTWSIYLDGSDLPNFAAEDIYGVGVYANGDVYLSTSDSFSAPGLSIKDEDVFAFSPTSLGNNTSGVFVAPLFFDGSEYGLAAGDIYSLHIPATGPRNIAPVAIDDAVSVSEDSVITIDVLADNGNGSDVDSDGSLVPASTVVVGFPVNGLLLNDGDGRFRYTPTENYFGTDGFTYRVQDERGTFSNVATVAITIHAVNDPPIARDDEAVTSEGSAVTVRVLEDNGHGADSDLDGNVIATTAVALTLPANGTLTDNGDGSFEYVPNTSFLGVDRFTYVVLDNEGATSNPATVTITVTDDHEASLSLYFTVDRPHTFANGLYVEPEDIVFYDGVDFSQLFDGSDVGLEQEKLGSISVISPSEILFTFNREVALPGVTGTVSPTDVVKFNATQLGPTTLGSFELYFRGSNVGFDVAGETIDGLKLLDDGRLIISTLGSFSVPGVAGNDEDLLAFTPTTLGSATAGSWAMYFDGSDVGWSGQDVDAVALDAEGKIYLSGKADLLLDGLAVADEDVVVFTPTRLGTSTGGSYDPVLFFDGSRFGLEAVNLKGIDVTTSGPRALRATGHGSTELAFEWNRRQLAQSDVERALPLAWGAWQAAGYNVAAVGRVIVAVDQLPGAQLGQAFGNVILLDRDAAGAAWHVDVGSAAVAAGHYDLLTVLTHELGHVLGFEHSGDSSVMMERLDTASRSPAPLLRPQRAFAPPAGDERPCYLRSSGGARDSKVRVSLTQRSMDRDNSSSTALVRPGPWLAPKAVDRTLAEANDWVAKMVTNDDGTDDLDQLFDRRHVLGT